MAEAIVSDLAAALIRKLASLATDQVIQVWKLDEDLATLRERFELTGALLNDAHSRNLIMSTAKMWFNKLEGVARVAEAFMDQLEYQLTRRKVEDDVTNMFPNRMWVTVSDDFDFTRILNQMVASLTSKPYQVQKLSEEDSWKLFKHRAFTDGGVLETEAFTALGRRMVTRCGGLPLAIKTLGGLLYSKKTEKEWLRIQNSEIWKHEGVLSSLRLSYDNLPYSSLKRCFAYCSVIPKDSYIYKDELIEIWMALGFLSGDGSALMEDIGNEYFDILLWNSFLQDVVRDQYGNIYYCKMHDLVHDLALDVSGNCSATVVTSHDINRVSKALYVRLEGFEDLKPKNLKSSFDTVQALYAKANIFSVLLPNLEHLRVLVLNSVCKELPSSIENLKYLKHLDISGIRDDRTRIKLPIYITRLYNLQTLRISYSHELPKKVCSLINLRHIDNFDTGYMFIGIERLTCLQTMPPFVVSRDQNCLVGQLGGLKNLRGKLSLHDLNEVENFEEASKAKLCEKSNIQHLQLKWRNNGDEREDREYNDEDVMEGLEAHPNLKGLTVNEFMGKKFASWIKKMTNLVKITLENCNRCEVLPPLGHLPILRIINIKRMKIVKVIGNNLCGGVDSGVPKAVTTTLYPSLIELSLCKLPMLEEWVETVTSTGVIGQSVFPKLERLSIRECPRLRKMPNISFPCLKELDIRDLESSMILESLSRNVSSLTSLQLTRISDGGGGGDSSTSSSSCWNMECIINALLKNNSLSLTELELDDCKGLKRLTLGVSVDTLWVRNCPHVVSINSVEGFAGLKSISIRGLPSTLLDGLFAHIQSSTLETLVLGPFSDEPEEFTWPFSSVISFPNLTTLELYGWEKVKSTAIFDQLQFPTIPALTRLNIINFNGVKALPDSIAKLPSLKKLFIWRCDILESLPMFEESHGLESLEISGCPILKERYSKGSGPEWFKIQHIPDVYIY